jgi:pimeloyl-ACP methyl ester carboxylesterase
VDERSLMIAGEEPIPGVILTPAGRGPHPVILVLHGQGASKDLWVPRVRSICERGTAVVLIDARLHGERARIGLDPGRPMPVLDLLALVDGTARDVVAVLDRLRSVPNLRTDRVAVRGFSLGAQIALVAAARDRRLDPVIAVGASLTVGPLDPADYPASRPDPELLRRAVTNVNLGPDAADRLRALAGRRLLFVHGLLDRDAPWSRVHDLVVRLAPAYADDPGGLSLLTYAGGHHPPANIEALIWDWVRSTPL